MLIMLEEYQAQVPVPVRMMYRSQCPQTLSPPPGRARRGRGPGQDREGRQCGRGHQPQGRGQPRVRPQRVRRGPDDAEAARQAQPQTDGRGVGEPAAATAGNGELFRKLCLQYEYCVQSLDIFVLPMLTISLQVLTVVVSAYFVVKALLWLNKSM